MCAFQCVFRESAKDLNLTSIANQLLQSSVHWTAPLDLTLKKSRHLSRREVELSEQQKKSLETSFAYLTSSFRSFSRNYSGSRWGLDSCFFVASRFFYYLSIIILKLYLVVVPKEATTCHDLLFLTFFFALIIIVICCRRRSAGGPTVINICIRSFLFN